MAKTGLMGSGNLAARETLDTAEAVKIALAKIDPAKLDFTDGMKLSNDKDSLLSYIEIMREYLTELTETVNAMIDQRNELIDAIVAAHPAQREHFDKIR